MAERHQPGSGIPSTGDVQALPTRLDELASENDVLLARIANDSVRLAAVEAELGAARLRTATVEAELAQLHDRYETDTGNLRHRLVEVDDEYHRVEELLRAEQVRSEDRDRHVEQIQNSVSYRLTRPLRFVQRVRLDRRSAERPTGPN